MSMKTITVIQKVMLMLCALLVVSACSYDDEEIWNKVNDHETRISALEDWQKQVNSNITALQELLNTQDYITKVSPLVENGVEVGYSIYFAKSDSIALYHGIKGEDGVDGYVPAISVKKDTDGIYYWTLDGDWLTDSEGHKIKAEGTDGKDGADGEDGKDGQDGEDGKDGANGSNGHNGTNGRDGITSKLKIEEGTWYVSYDKGATWEKLGVAIIEDGGDSGETTVCTCPITDVDIQTDKVIFTLDSGDEFEVPYYEESDELTITFKNTEIELEAGGTTELTYTLSYEEGVKVSAIGEGVRTKIKDDQLTITATAENFEGGKVLVHATDGKRVATVELTVTKMVITYIEYTATEEITPSYDAFGGEGIQFLEDKSTFEDGKGKWAYKGIVTYIIDSGFIRNTKLKSITLPESIIDIGRNVENYPSIEAGGSAFENCTALENITIKGNLETLRKNTFNGCSSLKSITLPETLTLIQYNAFKGCSSLESITIPDKVTTIEKQVFSQCTSLKSVIIGESVASIGQNAFNKCEELATITCKGETPATLGFGAFMEDDAWTSTKYIQNIYVPSNAVDAYKAATGWKDYKDRISAITE